MFALILLVAASLTFAEQKANVLGDVKMCDLCKNVVKEAENLTSVDETVVKELVTKQCSALYADEWAVEVCKATTNPEVPALVPLIKADTDPTVACTRVKLCAAARRRKRQTSCQRRLRILTKGLVEGLLEKNSKQVLTERWRSELLRPNQILCSRLNQVPLHDVCELCVEWRGFLGGRNKVGRSKQSLRRQCIGYNFCNRR